MNKIIISSTNSNIKYLNDMKSAGSNQDLAIIGAGRVGLPMAICYAAKGYFVEAVDSDSSKIMNLKKGIIITKEKYITQLFSQFRNNINFSTDAYKTILNNRINLIIVPTPSKKDGSYSLKNILDVMKIAGKALKKTGEWKIIAIISTVMPSTMEKVIKPILEKISGKIAGKDFGLCYSPEFIALGEFFKTFTSPDFLLIGNSDSKSAEIYKKIRKSICSNNPPVLKTNFINSEIAKLSSNSYMTLKISFANMIARICEKIPGADIDVISGILANDRAIGRKKLTGSISYSGPCYPKDNLALIKTGMKLNININPIKIIHEYNKKQENYLFSLVNSFIKKDRNRLAILGLSYKPDTDITDESQGIKLALKFLRRGIRVTVFDPAAINNAKLILGNKVRYAKTVNDSILNADVIVITTPWSDFKNISLDKYSNPKSPKIIIDCWRILNEPSDKGIIYIPLGKCIKW